MRSAGTDWQTLDKFVVNEGGTALVGTETGAEIGKDAATLSYSGGAVSTVEDDLQFRFVSAFSASNEIVRLDNFEITRTMADEAAPDDGKGVPNDVQYISGIPVLKPIDEDQLKAAINEVDGDDEDDIAVRTRVTGRLA